jgi:hypothetical protein
LYGTDSRSQQRPRQHDRAAARGAREPLLEQRALADAGFAANRDHHRPVDVEGGVQHRQLGVAPEERFVDRRLGVRIAAEHAQDVVATGALRRIDHEQPHAQRVEIIRQILHQQRRPDRQLRRLRRQHLADRSAEGEPSTQRRVQHHADRVPIDLRPDHAAARLLRRHVRRCPHHVVIAIVRAADIAHQAKIEHDDPSVARH